MLKVELELHPGSKPIVPRLGTSLLILLSLFLVAACSGPAPTESEQGEVVLCQGQYQTPEEGKAQLERFSETFSNSEEWRERAEVIRQGILRGAGFDPPPPAAELNPTGRNIRSHDGYSVENVAIQTLPGLYLRGNLYQPLDRTGPFPAVLSPHGHFPGEDGDRVNGAGRFREDQQIRCAMLARMGAVVYSYEMFGWGESARDLDFERFRHDNPDVLSFQLQNGMKAVDFLLSLPEVDPERIGVTGASGGGTQTFLLTAVDPRIKASAPMVMVASHFFGGCGCESGKPIHKSATHETNNADIAAMAAPRPQLLVSIGADWTRTVPDIEYPYIRDVYRLFGAQDKAVNVHLEDEQHNYGPSKRRAMYDFFSEHFELDGAPFRLEDGSYDESGVVIESVDEMIVFPDASSLPANFKSATDLPTFRELASMSTD